METIWSNWKNGKGGVEFKSADLLYEKLLYRHFRTNLYKDIYEETIAKANEKLTYINGVFHLCNGLLYISEGKVLFNN